ncbi:MAG: N-acetyltransferase [Alphaproteobacteria bacterium]|nr:MAG: N-acetyltransferase [Alphaproteobacteria bacterium]
MQDDGSDLEFHLVTIGVDGSLAEPLLDLAPAIVEACQVMADLYDRLGYEVPWTGYIATLSGTAVGMGAFVGPPVEGQAEISYFVLPEHEGKGLATLIARQLVTIARGSQADVRLFAKTLPAANASTRILQRLGFQYVGSTTDHEIGEAWAWML